MIQFAVIENFGLKSEVSDSGRRGSAFVEATLVLWNQFEDRGRDA